MYKSRCFIFILIFSIVFTSFSYFSGYGMDDQEHLIWLSSNHGLNAGVVSDIVFNPDKQELWASTIRGGVYVLPPDSKQWQSASQGLNNWWVHSMMVTPEGLFAGTEDFIFRYDRLKHSWQAVDENIKQVTVKSMIWFQHQGQLVGLAGTNKGIYRTEDHGFKWTNISFGNTVYDITAFAVSKPNDGFVIASAIGNWLLISYDGGKSWNKASEKPALTELQSLWIDRADHRRWYAGTFQQGMLMTTDGAFSWTRHNQQLDNMYISKIWQHPQTMQLWISSYDGMYYSEKDALVWQKKPALPLNSQINCFWMNENNDLLYVGTQGDSVYSIKLGENHWEDVHTGMDNVHVRTLVDVDEGRYQFIGTWGSGIFRSNDKGKTWKRVNQGITNPFILCIEKNARGDLFAGTFNGGIFRSSNRGESWERIFSPTLFTRHIYSIAFDPLNDQRIYLGSEQGTYRSVDDGASWARLGPGNMDQPAGEVLSLAINPNNFKQIYAGTRASGIHVSQDGGESWIPTNAGLTNVHITKVLFHPTQGNTLYVSTFGGGVSRSVDGGASWQNINQNLRTELVYSIFIEKHRPEVLYAATENGVYSTLFGSTSWQLYGTGIQRLSVRSIGIDTRRNLIMAGTYGRGLYTLQSLPPPPKLQDPQDNAEIITLRPTLSWIEPMSYNEPLSYRIQISQGSGFSQILHEMYPISGDQYIIPNEIIKKHESYYWRVRSETDVGSGPWSTIYTFHTITLMMLRINESTMRIDHVETEVDPGRGTTPIIRNQRTFMPIRAITEPVAAVIDWIPETRTVLLSLKEKQIRLVIDKALAEIDGNTVYIDPLDHRIAPFIYNGRTMLPLRFIAETFNFRIEWEASTQTITLIYPDKK